jgi:hypothetical protein
MEDNSSWEALEENTKPCSDSIMIKLQRKQSGALTLMPRDRIELPTRGFSDQIFENSKNDVITSS